MATSKTHSLISVIGFGGVVALFGAAITIGETSAAIRDNTTTAKDAQKQLSEVIAEVHVEQQEITDMDRRVTRLEDRK